MNRISLKFTLNYIGYKKLKKIYLNIIKKIDLSYYLIAVRAQTSVECLPAVTNFSRLPLLTSKVGIL